MLDSKNCGPDQSNILCEKHNNCEHLEKLMDI